MNDAIKLAIEKGGYDYQNHNRQGKSIDYQPVGKDAYERWRFIEEYEVLKPAFWQALGKALDLDNQAKEITNTEGTGQVLLITWKSFACYYFEIVLAGGDTEKFWKELLSGS